MTRGSTRASRADRLERIWGVYAIADDDPRWPNDVARQIEAALAGGSPVVQLRLKHSSDREALELGRWARVRTLEADALLIVNDRFDLADLCGADGVHMGQDDLLPEDLPAEIRRRLIVGLSTHDLEQVRAAQQCAVDYLGFGPVFATGSKPDPAPPRGVAELRAAVELASRPVVAIGGIGLSNVAEVARAGASAAAVISALATAPDPVEATRTLRRRFEASGEQRCERRPKPSGAEDEASRPPSRSV